MAARGGIRPGVGGSWRARPRRGPGRLRLSLTGGGTDGNEELTATTGVVLIVLLAVLGVTIVFIGQLIWLHLFLGLILIGPVGLKMASTGYRFARYYTRGPAYTEKGPPQLWLRLLAPLVVISTVVVFASGVVLLVDGPSARGTWLGVHKVSFFAWLAITALHVLGHLPRLPRQLHAVKAVEELGGLARGRAGRWILMAGSMLAGLVLALALIPHYGAWTVPGVLHHHHHHG